MINRLSNTRWFYISYLILFGLGLVFYFYQEHGDFVLFLNDLHNPIWNFFFKYWTYTGNGFFYAVLSIVLIFINRRLGIIMSVSGITIGAVSYFFKFVLFDATPRPKLYFLDHKILDFVDGVNVLSEHSFPSGHSMAVFGIATMLSLYLQNKYYSIILLIGAILTATSRVYLAQHFLIDIMAGSLLGIIIATSFYFGFEKYLHRENSKPPHTPDEELEAMNLDV